MPVGPSGKKLNSSYRFRDTEEYKAELGNVVVNFARVVPDGLLVFFPSYGVMRSCVATWQQPATPPSGNESAPRNSPSWSRGTRWSSRARSRISTRRSTRPAPAGRNGAAFFAVCRGKVSEGIDFADKAGRAVILTGIPYAPKADAKVRIKRSFLDNEASAARAEGGAGGGGLTGEQWYSQTAMRAVNQALGRVIRHRNDFGAVILADERFGYGNVRGQLSVWLRPAVQSFDSFGKAAAKLAQFFRHHAANAAPPLPEETHRRAVRRARRRTERRRFESCPGRRARERERRDARGSRRAPGAISRRGGRRAARVSARAPPRTARGNSPPCSPRNAGTGDTRDGDGDGDTRDGDGENLRARRARESARPRRRRPPREHPPPPPSPRTPPRRSNSSCVARARAE